MNRAASDRAASDIAPRPDPDPRRAGQLLAWGALIALGARRGGILGILALGYGFERLSRLVLGVSFGQLALAVARASSTERRFRFGEGTRDLVDEASWESFPASDPPGRGVTP